MDKNNEEISSLSSFLLSFFVELEKEGNFVNFEIEEYMTHNKNRSELKHD